MRKENYKITSFSIEDRHRDFLAALGQRYAVSSSAIVRRLIDVLEEYHDNPSHETETKTTKTEESK